MAIFNVKNYGALGDGAHDDTQAFIQASQALTAAKGGTLLIPPGTYMVGQQTFANGMGKGFAYQASDIITIKDCTQPVIIEGNGAVLKMQPGLKFGSFDPVTGQPYYPSGTGAFTNANYGADLGYMILLWKNTAQVVVRDLELNGQIDSAVLGGRWGDQGYQRVAYGIFAHGCQDVHISNVYTHHHCLDGVCIGQPAAASTATSARNMATLINVRSEYNARQGLSWVGGNGLTAIGCKFNHTGRAAFGSSPQSGIDIEASGGAFIRNGMFINCEMVNNVGVGMGADSGSSSDISFIACTFLGTTNYSALSCKPHMHFADCTFSGMLIKPYSDHPRTNPVTDDANSQGRATQFSRCLFTDKLKYNNQVYVPTNNGTTVAYLLNFGGGSLGVKLDHCVVGVNQAAIGYSAGLITSTNCQFYQTSTTFPSVLYGLTVGRTLLSAPTMQQLTGTSIVMGRAMFGTTEYHQGANMAQSHQQLLANTGNASRTQRIGSGSSPEDFLAGSGAEKGDIVFNADAVSGAAAGWVCVSAGTPGVWKSFASVAN